MTDQRSEKGYMDLNNHEAKGAKSPRFTLNLIPKMSKQARRLLNKAGIIPRQTVKVMKVETHNSDTVIFYGNMCIRVRA